MIKSTTKILWALPVLLSLCAPARAQFRTAATVSSGTVPSGMIFQGRLEDAGVPASGVKTVIFRLFDAASGGTELWTSGEVSIDVSGGVFGAVLDIPLTALAGPKQRYLEIWVSGVRLEPRDPLQSVPYAKIAESVEGSIDISTGGFEVRNAGGVILFISSQTAQVGIGTDSFPSPAMDNVKLRIEGGDVLIGEPDLAGATPNDDLFIEGNLSVDGQVSFQGSSFGNLGVSTGTGPGELFKVSSGALTVLDTGRVGISTRAPAAWLDVQAGAGVTTGILLDHPSRPRFKMQVGGVDHFILEHDGVDARVNAVSSTMTFDTNGSSRVWVMPSGNVGIGAAPGNFKLDVDGNLNVTSSVTLSVPLAVANGGTGSTGKIDAQSALSVPSRVGENASGTWDIDIADLGGGGGNAAKAAALSAAPALCTTSGQFAKGIAANGDAQCADVASEIPEADFEGKVYDDDNDLDTIGGTAAGPWTVAASGTNDITFDTAGNTLHIDVDLNRIGIGTNSPGATLEVNGQVKITGGTPGVAKVLTSDAAGLASWQVVPPAPFQNGGDTATADRTFGNTDNFGLGVLTNNTERITIEAGGNVGIGTAPGAPADKLDVAGNINASGQILQAGQPIVPAKMVMLFNLAACPSGWTELTQARGRALVGLPNAGTLLGVPNPAVTALTNQENRTHTHDLQSHTHQVDPDGAGGHVHGPGSHTHDVDPGGNHSHDLNSHTHSVDPGGNHNHSVGNHTHNVDLGSSGSSGPSATANVNSGSTSVGGPSHTHNFDPPAATSGGGSGNTGDYDPSAVTSGGPSADSGNYNPPSVTSGGPSASNTAGANLTTVTSQGPSTNATNAVSHTMPYIQLLVCEKS